MAITKILNINCATEGNPAAHLKNALEYIQNPDKTEQCHLVGSVNCLPDTAYDRCWIQRAYMVNRGNGRDIM